MSERVAIFIDGSNLYHGLKSINNTRIDFEKFAALLVGARSLVRTYYFNAPSDQAVDPKRYQDQQRFYSRLGDVPYFSVHLGRLEPRKRICPHCNKEHEVYTEKGVDVNLVVNMLSMAHQDIYDTAVLVSGDGDFASAVEAVKHLGKHVEVACFTESRSDQLRKTCDIFTVLDANVLKGCLIK